MIVRHRLSLSQRLLVGLLIVSFAYWAVIAWMTIRDSVDDVYELFDAHLAQTGLALLRVTDPDDDDPLVIPNRSEAPALKEIFTQWPDLPERLASARSALGIAGDAATAPMVPGKGSRHSLHVEYEKRLRYQIWNRDGLLLLRSANAPAEVMTAHDGFSESTDDAGQQWRHYGVWDRHHDFRILVSEAHDLRNQLVRSIALHLVSPLALGLPVLIFLLWYSISRGLDPLGALTREIEKKKAENLEPLDADSAPGEVRPMVLALNKLLRRMTQSLESERLFTANAAHELRTPLAAIQAQLHAARGADGDAERLRAMDQLQRGVERGIRLVGQLLTLARLDPEQALPDVQPVNPGDVAEAVCAELAPLALRRDQVLELQVEPDLPSLSGNADMLSMLLCNLVDNAIRYTQTGGHIDVAIRRDEAGVLMRVSDNGPGIPEAQRKAVFERFYRIAGQDQPGTGLGLAICRRIVELHNARIVLTDGPGTRGLTASVLFAAV
ncbi:MAG: two-component system OmpR family sensor histidine kinase QseC [Rhodocyclaceae bacterium]|nr:MAG: two-component system OmpR family sensor histidine kinase QseC [Rhodocyclaceae bacterium]TND03104.1 MAG: two-component system, OmpR family, sensor histidine kinase QseC [Rhodocyclaceae bacterium]